MSTQAPIGSRDVLAEELLDEFDAVSPAVAVQAVVLADVAGGRDAEVLDTPVDGVPLGVHAPAPSATLVPVIRQRGQEQRAGVVHTGVDVEDHGKSRHNRQW